MTANKKIIVYHILSSGYGNGGSMTLCGGGKEGDKVLAFGTDKATCVDCKKRNRHGTQKEEAQEG